MKIEINDKEVTLRLSFRAYMIYENITGKSFAPATMTDIINFFFCVLITSANDYDLKYNDFLDILDARPEYMTEFSEWLAAEFSKNDRLGPDVEDDKKKVKAQKK